MTFTARFTLNGLNFLSSHRVPPASSSTSSDGDFKTCDAVSVLFEVRLDFPSFLLSSHKKIYTISSADRGYKRNICYPVIFGTKR